MGYGDQNGQFKKVWLQRRRRLSEIIEVGSSDDYVSRVYDIFSVLMLLEGDCVILYSQERISSANTIKF